MSEKHSIHCPARDIPALINNVYLDTPISLWTLFVYCFVLPIPGDIFLCIVAAFLARRVQRTIAA